MIERIKGGDHLLAIGEGGHHLVGGNTAAIDRPKAVSHGSEKPQQTENELENSLHGIAGFAIEQGTMKDLTGYDEGVNTLSFGI